MIFSITVIHTADQYKKVPIIHFIEIINQHAQLPDHLEILTLKTIPFSFVHFKDDSYLYIEHYNHYRSLDRNKKFSNHAIAKDIYRKLPSQSYKSSKIKF